MIDDATLAKWERLCWGYANRFDVVDALKEAIAALREGRKNE